MLNGSHKLKCVIVRRSIKPHAIKNIMDMLSVQYYKKFHKKAVPEIRKYQTQILKIFDDKVKALILLDKIYPAHP